ncbi:MAG TPA: thioredoxin [Microscillaceae bacterium]|jgi:thioredoxin|nr:thioredoxin [Microscillaceae bacterium]
MSKIRLSFLWCSVLSVVVLLVQACGSGSSSKQVLSADDFDKQLKSTEKAQLIDVRTTKEFEDRHLANAQNIDINSSDFQTKMMKLDKEVPTFVYCLSGGRSKQAADWMRSQGFKQVFELKGGINKWVASKKPVEKGQQAANASLAMSLAEFQQMLKSEAKPVLVDFGAEWCAPCKKMKPTITKLTQEMASTHKIVQVDIDESSDIALAYRIEAVPTLILFKKGEPAWQFVGLASEDIIRKALQ